MFPKLFSSSREISSKCNAFVQNKDDGNESVISLCSLSPDVKVPEMWDELLVNSGESKEEVPNLTVITGHPSQTHTVHHTTSSMDSVVEPDMSSQLRASGVDNTGVLSVVLSRKVSDNTTRDKPDIPRTNDTDADESFKVCDYYSRWGIERVRLLGGGESGVAAAGTQNWGQTGGGPQGGGPGGWPSGGPTSQPHRQQNNNTQAQPAGPSSQQSQAQGGGNQQVGQPNQTSSNQPVGSNQPNNQSNNTGNNQQPSNNSGPNNNQPGSNSNNNQPSSNQQQNNNNQSNNSNQQPGGNQPNNNNNWSSKPGQQPQPTSTKQQLEQLNSMREALYSQDGWGGQNVNQDSSWDIPGSPEPGTKESMSGVQPPMWKPNVNNGTDLWENNLRNGGVVAPPAAPVPKAPITHTPTSHHGGVWGEEDEGDFSNMWTGVPPAGGQTPAAGPPQWPGGPGGPQPPAAVWPGKKEGEWGGPGGAGGGGWGDPRHDMRPDGIRGGDHRGISGRLNGEAMWPHHPHKVPGGTAGGPGAGGGGWGTAAPPLKDMGGLGKPSGWEEPSPPAQRRTMPNYDDGTSLWGQQNRPAMPGQGKVSHWKDLPSGGQPMGRGGGMPCPPGARNPNMKPEQGGPMWHPQAPGGVGPRNGWESGVEPCWGEDKPAAAPWLDQPLPPTWPGAANKHKHPWEPELEPNPASSWSMHPAKQPAAKGNKDFMWNSSRPYRVISEMGYKKDEVENALRNNSMAVEDALDPQAWGARRGGHDGMDGPNDPHGGLFGGGPAQVCIPFQAGPTGPPGALQQAQASRQQQPTPQPSAQQLRMLVQQIQTAVHAGYLQQQILNQPLAPQTLILLNQLLQQIKILQHLQQLYQAQQNPLKPAPSNVLVQTQVKLTQTKQQIVNIQNQINSQQALYISQQKQQQQAAQQMPPQPQQQNDLFRSNMHDPLAALQSNFTDMAIKDSQMVSGYPGSQSRLNQWKLPLSLDKETDVVGGGGGEFSRAPGSKGGAGGGGGSPLLPDGAWSSRDTGASWPPSDTSSDPASDPSKDWPSASQQPPAFSDLVPEFKPGEPWKGNIIKTADDDPTMTPSSIVRSPLVLPSLNLKDSPHILGGGPSVQGKSSPTSSDLLPSIPSLSLSTSTWTFNPSTQPQTSTSSIVKIGSGAGGGASKSGGAGTGWAETGGVGVGGELWSSGGGGKGRPPPGLGGNKPGATPTSTNSWSSAARWSQNSSTGQPTNWNASTWLLLRNLTPQIDGSTLKTLCIQHGPLINFHLFLNNGIALARYSSREEAQKAQGALNNCVLGNTTIFAENPSDSDVMPLVTHLQNQGGGGGGSSGGGGGGGAGGGAGAAGAGTPWRTPTPGGSAASQLWSSSTSSLWGADTPTTTNSSFLPADLGGESM